MIKGSRYLAVNFLGVVQQLLGAAEAVDDVEGVADVAADQDVVTDAMGRSQPVVGYQRCND